MTTKNYRFTLTFPDGWCDTTIFTFSGPEDSGVKHNIVVTVDPFFDKKMSIAAYAKQRVDELSKTFPAFELLNQCEKLIHDEYPAFESVYKYMPADNLAIYQKLTCVAYKDRSFSFTSTFSKKTIQTIGYEVDMIINTFVPTPDKE